MELQLEIKGTTVNILLIYRPEPSNNTYYTMSEFYSEITEYLAKLHTKKNEIIIAGDFNIHMNKKDDKRAQELNDILSMLDVKQHVYSPTHEDGNTLDLIITRNNKFLSDCKIDDMNSDHNCITFQVNCERPAPQRKTITSRNMRDMDQKKFTDYLRQHFAGKLDKNENSISFLNELVKLFNDTASILDKVAPQQTRTVTIRDPTPWTNRDIKWSKIEKRKAERKWKISKSPHDYEAFKTKRNEHNKLLRNLRHDHLSKKIENNKGNSRAMFKTINAAINMKQEPPLPIHENAKLLADKFKNYFNDKVVKIRAKLDDKATDSSNELLSEDREIGNSDENSFENRFTGTYLEAFLPLSCSKI